MNNGPDWCQKDMKEKKKKEIKSLLCGNESGFLRRFDAFILKTQTSKKKKKKKKHLTLLKCSDTRLLNGQQDSLDQR